MSEFTSFCEKYVNFLLFLSVICKKAVSLQHFFRKHRQTMKSKKERITHIREVIHNSKIDSQEELLKALSARGIKVTQATLSRDLKQMQIVKVAMRDGGYIYMMPEDAASSNEKPGSLLIPKIPHILSIENSSVMIVIRTTTGYASGVAADLDAAALPSVMATLAGDDTVLVIPRGGYTMAQVVDELVDLLTQLNNQSKYGFRH